MRRNPLMMHHSVAAFVNNPLHIPPPSTSTATPTNGAWVWRVTLVGLVCLLLWDASGLDLLVMQHIGTPSGFALTNNYWLSHVLHTGARNASVVLFLLLWVLALAWPRGQHPQLGARGQRVWLLTGVTLSLLLISGLKAASATSCPWDLAEFGGVTQYVSHWDWAQTGGGPGRCFPGGHASSAFAYLALLPPLLLASNSRTRQQAGITLWSVVAAGLLLGLVQTLRGAHFPSHTLWTAWLCWTAAWLWFALGQWFGALRQARQQRQTLPT